MAQYSVANLGSYGPDRTSDPSANQRSRAAKMTKVTVSPSNHDLALRRIVNRREDFLARERAAGVLH